MVGVRASNKLNRGEIRPLEVHAGQGSKRNKVLSFAGPHTQASGADDSRTLHSAAHCLYAQSGSSSSCGFTRPREQPGTFAAFRSLFQVMQSTTLHCRMAQT